MFFFRIQASSKVLFGKVENVNYVLFVNFTENLQVFVIKRAKIIFLRLDLKSIKIQAGILRIFI